MSSLTRIIILIVLLVLSFFFAMSESAFSYCNQIRLKVSASEGKNSSKLVLKYLENFDKYIIVNLICSNVVILLFSVLSTILCVNIILDINPDITSANEYGALISTIASTLVIFFFGEIIPKGIGKTFPNQICNIIVYPIFIIDIILTPISLLFRGLVFLIRKIFKEKEEEPLVDEEDFQDIVDSIEEKGLIEKEESEIIQSAVEFDDLKVKEVMCERDNIVALDISKKMNRDELIDYLVATPYTRIPVYENDIDHIIGILHTQRLLKQLMLKHKYEIKKMLVEPILVRPNVHLDTIFNEFKKKRTHIAVVQDKDLKTLGIVTMEDVLEKLIGEIDESHEGGDNNG